VDEFSYRKRHRYVTIVVDHDRRRVIWTCEGKGKAALERFFAKIGPEACQELETVTMDMAAGYRRAVEDHAPRAVIVFVIASTSRGWPARRSTRCGERSSAS
jgi:transposase